MHGRPGRWVGAGGGGGTRWYSNDLALVGILVALELHNIYGSMSRSLLGEKQQLAEEAKDLASERPVAACLQSHT